MPRTSATLLFAAVAVLMAAACSPIISTHGNMVPKSALSEIEPGVSTRADVSTKWGPPTTVPSFDPNTWYYIGQTDSQKGIFEPKMENRQVIKVVFDQEDLVTEVTPVDSKLAQNIEPVERKTPAAGKEYTVFQQFIGNLGKFNPASAADKDSR